MTEFFDLNPIGEPPSRGARWCPGCQRWLESVEHRGRRRCGCSAALVRPVSMHDRPLAGELRPGVVAEFADPRDRYDPARELTTLRERHYPSAEFARAAIAKAEGHV